MFGPVIHSHVASDAPGFHAEHEELVNAVVDGEPERGATAAKRLLDAVATS